MTDSLKDRAMIVTGAGSGIGRACCFSLAARGSALVLVDNRTDAVVETADEIRQIAGEERVHHLILDVCREADMQRMADEALERFGRIDALVAAAGILRQGKGLHTVSQTSLDEWDAVIGTNLTGTFLSNRAVLSTMIARKSGDIINISSTSGRRGRPFDGAYCASKFGIIGLSESLAEEVAAHGVRVQSVLPDAVDTPLWDQNASTAVRPSHTLAPERVAEFIAYLLELPRDMYLLNPTIMPFKTRKRRSASQRT